MFPFGSLGGFHFRMIWDEEFDEDMGSRGTEGSEKQQQKAHQLDSGKKLEEQQD